ncbi:Sporulation factor SpoIIGA [compost metagenome]
MLALKPDEVTVVLEGREIRITRVLVGLDGGRLSSEGAYRAIIHPSLAGEAEDSGTDRKSFGNGKPDHGSRSHAGI